MNKLEMRQIRKLRESVCVSKTVMKEGVWWVDQQLNQDQDEWEKGIESEYECF